MDYAHWFQGVNDSFNGNIWGFFVKVHGFFYKLFIIFVLHMWCLFVYKFINFFKCLVHSALRRWRSTYCHYLEIARNLFKVVYEIIFVTYEDWNIGRSYLGSGQWGWLFCDRGSIFRITKLDHLRSWEWEWSLSSVMPVTKIFIL